MTLASRGMSRLGALLVALLIVALFWVSVVGPVKDIVSETSSALIDERRLKSRLTASLADLKRRTGEISEPAFDALLWQGARSGEIGAAIQSKIGSIAREARVRFRNSATIDAGPLAGTAATSFRIEAEAPLDNAVAFLRALERSKPPLVVTRTSLRRLNRQNPAQELPTVYIRLEVAAPIQLVSRARP